MAPKILAFCSFSSWTSTAIISEAPNALAICKQLEEQLIWLGSTRIQNANSHMTSIYNCLSTGFMNPNASQTIRWPVNKVKGKDTWLTTTKNPGCFLPRANTSNSNHSNRISRLHLSRMSHCTISSKGRTAQNCGFCIWQ